MAWYEARIFLSFIPRLVNFRIGPRVLGKKLIFILRSSRSQVRKCGGRRCDRLFLHFGRERALWASALTGNQKMSKVEVLPRSCLRV